ncbi:MAG: minor extracellular serine protease Vpr, partial [Verrucomicrobiota bacterium]
DFNNSTTKSYRAQLSALRNDFKQWLQANAPKAKVTGEFDISLNAVSVQLNGESKDKIAVAPQVSRVDYEGIYYPLAKPTSTTSASDPDLGLIQAIQAWSQNGGGGSANAGNGVKAAIVDTGIDIGHPCFSDAGYPAQTQLGDRRFTNNKVIVAKVFNNKGGVNGYSAEAIQEHGSHVAGTVGCNYNTPATVNGVPIPYGISGVAPHVLLGNYNVFPGPVDNARSEDILNALEAAYADGFDVANMSLGGGAHGIQDLLTNAIDDLDQANMVVAVAAGNSGPGNFTVESPGSAARALTAGASTVPHFIGAPVTVNGQTYGAAVGDFKTVSSDMSAPLGVVLDGTSLSLGCSTLPAGSLTGKIALISRGSCTFSTKIRDAQNAGAVACLIVNNVAGDPTAMGQDGTANQPTIPAYMLGQTEGQSLVGANGSTVTIGAVLQYLQSANADIMAGFSSQGPTDVDFRVKPDVVAPGVNVLSSIPASFCPAPPCFAFFQGTSMATPHLAGSAAVVRQQHPMWTAAQVRSAVVNTADQGVLKNFKSGVLETDVNVTGTGRENLLSAVNSKVAVDPVSVSFGAVPSGSGQTLAYNVTLTNLGSGNASYSLSVGSGSGGVAYSVSPSSITIPAGGSASATVTMAASKGASFGGHSATVSVKSGANEVAHAVVYTFVK